MAPNRKFRKRKFRTPKNFLRFDKEVPVASTGADNRLRDANRFMLITAVGLWWNEYSCLYEELVF